MSKSAKHKREAAAAAEEHAGGSGGGFDPEALRGGIQRCLDHFTHELANLRIGRATPEMLDHLKVEAHGDRAPLVSLAAVSVKHSHLLAVSPYDPGVVSAVMKAIESSPLQLTPRKEGNEIEVPIPPPSPEMVEGMVKMLHTATEACRVSLRNLRRSAMNQLKQLASDDERRRLEKDVEKMVEKAMKQVDEWAKRKEKDCHLHR